MEAESDQQQDNNNPSSSASPVPLPGSQMLLWQGCVLLLLLLGRDKDTTPALESALEIEREIEPHKSSLRLPQPCLGAPAAD